MSDVEKELYARGYLSSDVVLAADLEEMAGILNSPVLRQAAVRLRTLANELKEAEKKVERLTIIASYNYDLAKRRTP